MPNDGYCQFVEDAPWGASVRRWTLRDDNHCHYHGVVSVVDSPLYLELSWRRTASSPVHRVGTFRLDLYNLLDDGYVRPEPADSSGPEIRLRIVHANDGQFYIQVNQDGPRLLMKTSRSNQG